MYQLMIGSLLCTLTCDGDPTNNNFEGKQTIAEIMQSLNSTHNMCCCSVLRSRNKYTCSAQLFSDWGAKTAGGRIVLFSLVNYCYVRNCLSTDRARADDEGDAFFFIRQSRLRSDFLEELKKIHKLHLKLIFLFTNLKFYDHLKLPTL